MTEPDQRAPDAAPPPPGPSTPVRGAEPAGDAAGSALLIAGGWVALVVAVVGGVVVGLFAVLAAFTLGVGIYLIVRRRTALGIVMVVAAVLVPVAEAVSLTSYVIPSAGMEPTVDIGDHVIVDRTGLGEISIGDIVAFHPPAGADSFTPRCANPSQGYGHRQACDQPARLESDQAFLKRVVAGPGDTITIRDGHVIRNGRREADSYIAECGSVPLCNFRAPIKIPAGEYFVLGDNRGASDDSRFWGPVPRNWIVGVAVMTTWPIGRIGLL